MKSKQAAKYFHGKEGYNCAQSVLKTFQQERNISEITIYQASALGGGRAEGGICGAIYSALMVSGDNQAAEKLLHKFHQKTGSIYCTDIRESREGCRELVKLATSLAEEQVKDNQ
ncbi:hypothetical protein DI392_10330 [Vibrio albus]|uniref:C_GCAxxG_C_C family protein n=1 Tax=Vibrio albus TaxID=2200953 RepID=A0A2U3B8W7_9VIBR|nr:C-GCAxxG-C-C family (seleno)protein [Vibrio albus]PWI33249.1 hypothetical protein DI392_10330 [Vibrio albus]